MNKSRNKKKGRNPFSSRPAAPGDPPPTSLYVWGAVHASSPFASFFPAEKHENIVKISIEAHPNDPSTDPMPVITSMAASDTHVLAVSNNGCIYGAGDNSDGQLKPLEPKIKAMSLPVLTPLVFPKPIVQVACGHGFSVVLTDIGRVYSFGSNRYGQLGHSEDSKTTFVAPRLIRSGIPHELIISVCCGELTTYVLAKQGTVYSCGYGKNGRLGTTLLTLKGHQSQREMIAMGQIDVDERSCAEMRQIQGALTGVPVSKISAGRAHCVAVTTTGNAFAWGSASQGQLGDLSPNSSKNHSRSGKRYQKQSLSGVSIGSPLELDLNGRLVHSCVAGTNHTLILTKSRRSVLGFGNGSEKLISVDLSILGETRKIAKISSGFKSSSILFDDGSLASSVPGEPFVFETFEDFLDLGGNFVDIESKDGLRFGLGLSAKDQSVEALASDILKTKRNQSEELQIYRGLGISGQQLSSATSVTLYRRLHRAIASMTALNASFLSSSASNSSKSNESSSKFPKSGIDVPLMLESTRKCCDYKPKKAEKVEQTRIRQKLSTLVAQLDRSAPHVVNCDQLRAFFILLVSPLLPVFSPRDHELLVIAIFSLPIVSRRRLFAWIYTEVVTPSPKLCVDHIVKPLVNRLDKHIRYRKYTNQAVLLCKFLSCIYTMIKTPVASSASTDFETPQTSPKERIPSADFYTSALDSFSDKELQQMYLRWKAVVTKGREIDSPRGGQRNLGNSGLLGMLFGGGPTAFADFGGIQRQDSSTSLQTLESFSNPNYKVAGETFGLLESFGSDLVMTVDNSEVSALDASSPELVMFKHPFLLSASLKRRFVQLDDKDNQLFMYLRNMRQGRDPNLQMEVSRDDILGSTLRFFDKPDNMTTMSLRRPLKVKFTGEEGLDAGGVRKEFFLLLSVELFSPDYNCFEVIGSTNTLWFNNKMDTTTFTKAASYEMVPYKIYQEYIKSLPAFDNVKKIGILMGLAVYNDTLLDVQFPSLMYELLLQGSFVESDLDIQTYKKFDLEQANNLESILSLTDEEELEVLDLSFCVTQNYLGKIQDIELCENGANMQVTLSNRNEYVSMFIKHAIFSPLVQEQAKALTEGFNTVVPAKQAAFKLFNPDELELLLCGTPVLNLNLLKANCQYEGGYTDQSPTVKRFWELVDGFTDEEKQKFLKFCTGSRKAPVGGLKAVKFKIQRAGPDSTQLPSSHTCFNTLMIPDYSTKAKLKERLDKALEFGAGFGLQ